MTNRRHFLWPAILVFFTLWILRVLYLPSPITSDAPSFFINTSLRFLLFFFPILIASLYFLRDSFLQMFALVKPTITGWVLTGMYAVGIGIYLLSHAPLVIPANPWVLISFPFAPIFEELVFRGFIFSHILQTRGKVKAVLISSVLSVFIQFPSWIFISGFQGEQFLSLTGIVLLFSLLQGVVRLYGKSVYPPILIHLVNNALLLSTL